MSAQGGYDRLPGRTTGPGYSLCDIFAYSRLGLRHGKASPITTIIHLAKSIWAWPWAGRLLRRLDELRRWLG